MRRHHLKEAIIYRFSSLSYYKVRYPSWWAVSLGYVAIAIPLIAVVAVRRYRRKKDCDGTLLTTNPLC